ncbi:DUF4124 domain-containing protein [Wenzhouxiangella marina]|uniref:DUF4124 domain-containing protein n=1 Tax=Wenzhouxiangella marina TaxID=1579979 RepID=A0A0K0XT77_9GAMM|nr:DUF4124 domain-containing protein [Wenzhouxiangella marina]AKS40827.1 hypothetical protein WM2015_445 [Wenzhouxiangella marina]MBB6087701.1 hypothetical protein [Wenzhouxiangella marina]
MKAISPFKSRLATLGFLLMGLAFTALPAHAQDEIYKWVDEDGVTHFSTQPPENVNYQRLDVRTRRTTDVAPRTVGESEEGGDRADAAELGTLPEIPQIAAEAPDPELVAERCEQARENLMWLTERTRLSTEDEEGNRRVISEEERQRLIEETRAFITEWC